MTNTTGELSSRPAAEAYMSRVCFKVGPPRLVGAELEWFTRCPDGSRPSLDSLASALGRYAPRSIDPTSDFLPLPSGSIVSVEPGGQIELSSLPYSSASEVCDALASDEVRLRSMLEHAGIALGGGAADAHRPPERLLTLPRYCAMETRFERFGPFGKLMMCNTAAVQVSVDAGADADDIRRRWTLLHAVGPALVAAFACSPDLYGVPAGGWASQRMRTWIELDRTRTRVPLGVDPIADYAHWALDVPLLCVRRGETLWSPPGDATFGDWIDGHLDDEMGRRPDERDLDYHLTTLFPLVRASGHFEVRYLDGQPDGEWSVPVQVVDSLLRTPSITEEATALIARTAHRWDDAARDGLTDNDLRDAAVDLLTLVADTTAEPRVRTEVADAARRCRSGAMPAAHSREERA
ncbi:glutamate--cysteine ligase EgtA [Rhodococcoides trifolii]|uniref:Glutamate--cysteine ligase EgtA n=1 Tax=Rhodococcoides trifolii TaxID=908250 RepID=A0A917G0R5_9NOCA|nr:ergothioneine biosynthesis glutamate--cysteine ligase EgtA [Rhodococcus trifolii]GGG16836.1 glutamate--cysteine ligase EgtA [Rhodococcus trifolii]